MSQNSHRIWTLHYQLISQSWHLVSHPKPVRPGPRPGNPAIPGVKQPRCDGNTRITIVCLIGKHFVCNYIWETPSETSLPEPFPKTPRNARRRTSRACRVTVSPRNEHEAPTARKRISLGSKDVDLWAIAVGSIPPTGKCSSGSGAVAQGVLPSAQPQRRRFTCMQDALVCPCPRASASG